MKHPNYPQIQTVFPSHYLRLYSSKSTKYTKNVLCYVYVACVQKQVVKQSKWCTHKHQSVKQRKFIQKYFKEK